MWPSCEKCGRLCVRLDDKLCVFHKADRGDYNRSKRGTRRKKAKQVEPEKPESAKPVFPWSTKDGYFNGDMFEDWLNSTLDPSDPYYELQRTIKARDADLYLELVNEITDILKSMVLMRNRNRWQ